MQERDISLCTFAYHMHINHTKFFMLLKWVRLKFSLTKYLILQSSGGRKHSPHQPASLCRRPTHSAEKETGVVTKSQGLGKMHPDGEA
jgi:hypothetical protein